MSSARAGEPRPRGPGSSLQPIIDHADGQDRKLVDLVRDAAWSAIAGAPEDQVKRQWNHFEESFKGVHPSTPPGYWLATTFDLSDLEELAALLYSDMVENLKGAYELCAEAITAGLGLRNLWPLALLAPNTVKPTMLKELAAKFRQFKGPDGYDAEEVISLRNFADAINTVRRSRQSQRRGEGTRGLSKDLTKFIRHDILTAMDNLAKVSLQLPHPRRED